MMNMMPNNGFGMTPNPGMCMQQTAVPPGFFEAMKDPGAILKRIDLTPAALQNPNAAIQDLMNNGKLTQEQYNGLYQKAQELKTIPQVQQALSKIIGI